MQNITTIGISINKSLFPRYMLIIEQKIKIFLFYSRAVVAFLFVENLEPYEIEFR